MDPGRLILIASIGVTVLYSAANGDFSLWAGKQLLRFIFSLGILTLIAVVDIRFWLTQSYVLYCASLMMLAAVEFAGRIGKGGQRWIDLYVFNIQPSELIKITLLMALARYFHEMTVEDMGKTRYLLLPAVMILVPALLVLRQPDLGTATLLLFAGGALFFTAGIRLWKVAVVGGGVIVASPILWHFMYDYQKERVLTFLDPERARLGAGYNIIQANIALGSGGFLGKGFQSGSQSHLNFLPEKQTDFIFATYCEEFGVLGGVVLIFLYGCLLSYGYHVALTSRSSYGRLLALGLTTLLFLYMFINMAMVMRIVPVVGIPLPLVSYGGTAMLTVMMGVGLLMSIALHREVRIGRAGAFL